MKKATAVLPAPTKTEIKTMRALIRRYNDQYKRAGLMLKMIRLSMKLETLEAMASELPEEFAELSKNLKQTEGEFE
jgi:hypothetical protein